MKMTRAEWRYLQKIALDHPYYDTHALGLTEAEARAIVRENCTMTGKEFVDSVYAKLGMTRPEPKKKRFEKLRGVGELLAVPPVRRIAIILLAVVLAIVFFAATPTGRALAESAIQRIVTFFDDGSLLISPSDSDATLVRLDGVDVPYELLDETDDTENYVYVDTFDAFAEATGKTPFALPQEAAEIYYISDPEIDYLNLTAQYETPKGTIVVVQIWCEDDVVLTSTEGYTQHAADGSVYYSVYSVDEEREAVSCVKVFEDSVLTLYARGGFTLDEILALLTENGGS